MLSSPILLFIIIIINSCFAEKCCLMHTSEGSCGSEAGMDCEWLQDNDPLLTGGISGGEQCVTADWAVCEREPSCSPSPPPPGPKPPKPFQCVLHVCDQNHDPMNIAFVVDESGSVSYDNYLISLDFVENLIKNDINDASAISILAFGNTLDRVYAFTDSQNDQKAGALAAVKAERNDYARGWSTATALAMQEVVNEFTNSGITNGEENILFLLTDGKPNTGGSPCVHKPALNALGIRVIIVGISSGFSRSAVECLVDHPEDIKEIPLFTETYFYQMESKLRGVVCPTVYKEESIFANITNFVYDYGYNHVQYTLLSFVLLCGALFYYNKYYKNSINEKSKFISTSSGEYGSITTV